MTTLRDLAMTRRVLVTVGAGGVGKTTTAAALGVAAARAGRRVLCLTIDPARRLAESLGLAGMTTEARQVDPARFAAAGIPFKGELTAMMLDTKSTFDDLILRTSSSREKAERLLSNRLYKYMSTSLAGTQEYMAMEKLVQVKDDPRYDLVILDTPPTANALDFLDAPERLIGALDSAATKWFVEAFQSSGKLSLNLLARSAALVLRGIGKITGGSFLDAMAEFITQLNELFGGFRQRAENVARSLRGPDVSFLLVTSPAPMSLREAIYFSERLAAEKMPRGAFIVNRVRMPPPFAADPPTEGDARAAIAAAHLPVGAHAVATALDQLPAVTAAPATSLEGRLVRAHEDARKLAALDARHLAELAPHAGAGVPIVQVPELASDVYDVKLLSRVADLLVGT